MTDQDFLTPGQTYTISFAWSGALAPSSADLANIFQALPYASNVTVRVSGSISGYIDVTFVSTFATDGEILWRSIKGAWEELFPVFTVTFYSIQPGTKGVVTGSECGLSNLSACFSDLTTLGYIGIGILALYIVAKLV